MANDRSKGNLKATLAMWLKDPHCHWCGVLTFLVFTAGKLPNRAATRDHIVSRNNPKSRGHRANVVLACHACNKQRGQDEVAITHAKRLSKRERVLRDIARSL